ncbi:hypothetical protein Tco_0892162 [Tanacetum coccineum]|uniref:Uncharacterized protein n=1 Tax=Tanacetum coccineum TaxID=301880 RepID=A0ABQ5C533_9ASTR
MLHPVSPLITKSIVPTTDQRRIQRRTSEEEHADYPADGGDGDEESLREDTVMMMMRSLFEDERMDEEEEHLAPGRTSSAITNCDPVSLAGIQGRLRLMRLAFPRLRMPAPSEETCLTTSPLPDMRSCRFQRLVPQDSQRPTQRLTLGMSKLRPMDGR